MMAPTAIRRTILTGAAMLALVGCFNEPEPAYKTRHPDALVRLQDRGLRELPGPLNHEETIYVNLDRNALENLPEEILKCGKLKWLRLNDNRLKELGDLSALKELRRIYLKNNRLTQVPEGIKGLKKLTDVELSGNPVAEVPEWLTEMESLEKVSLNGTMVTKLPDKLDGWKKLKMLQLGDLRIPAEEMARIRKALPEVAIVF